MTLPVKFLAEAEAELDEAVAFYETRRTSLGVEFAKAVQVGVARIQQYPVGWQPISGRLRRCRLSRFPYGLLYAPLPSEIVIVAVMHLHRRPGYWRERLKQL